MGKLKISNFKKTLRYLKKNGIRPTYYAMKERLQEDGDSNYTYEPREEACLKEQERLAGDMHVRFSILVPAYETKEEYLRAMIDSVLAQTYGNFELIISDASSTDRVEKVVAAYTDKRIKYRKRGQNAGISANTGQALMYATGDYAGLLDHDDVLTRDALYEMAARIENCKKEGIQLQMLYSDEDKCDSRQERYYEPNRKPDFNLDLLLSNNYICHFLVMKRQLMQELGFRSICDGAQDYDIILRAVNVMLGKEKQQTRKAQLPVAHIPRVLYHWRCHEASTAENPASKQYAYDAGKRAVEDFLRARGWKGCVSHLRHLGFYRTDYQPDLLSNREDTAVVGGKLVDKKNKITGGIYTAEGTPLYKGLHREYSGYMHRASLQQEAEVIDVRCMKASREAELILEEMLGQPYLPHPGTGRFDWKECLQKNKAMAEEEILDLSRRFCEKIKAQGYRIVWDPYMLEKLDT
ncbi:MAG: glycosyltransferase [Clostridium sp.]|nr:glycosyltransferase [Clostridium sp.]